ncbi:MAG: type IX secretion system membrane protein PorP/SprF [Bacteroidia bacterium]|jgi:type IX secretion system PorP/SprF family membrane protein|nr:type IX secretion system membrane protein PorP/SprF [Bacteroidia bacterium]
MIDFTKHKNNSEINALSRYKIFSALFLFIFSLASGQVPDSSRINLGFPVYSQYLQNGLLINPAYTGTREVLSGFLSYRMQWMGTSGSPLLQSVSFHSPMKNDKVALGMMAQFMKYGATKSTSIYGSYAYHIKLKKGKISFGLKAGVDLSNTDYTGLLLNDPGDPVFESNEKSLVLPNVGSGVYYFSDRFFAGLAIPSFLNYRRTSSGSTIPYHSFSQYDFLFSAGALISITPVLKFKPSVLVDYSLQNTRKLTQFDINGNFIIADLIWAGGSWRVSEQVAVAILQVQLNNQLMFGFSYDYPFGRMNSYSKGSTEFILRYEFRYKVSAANPRYF